MSAAQSPKVFISYSHDSPEHSDWVLALANQLRQDGIDCEIDQYLPDAPERGWRYWMETEIEQADFVLLVCTEEYQRRFRGDLVERGHGVAYEGVVISQTLYEHSNRNNKFIPVCPPQSSREQVPTTLRGRNIYALPADYDKLYRLLSQQPAVDKPPLGKLRAMPRHKPYRSWQNKPKVSNKVRRKNRKKTNTQELPLFLSESPPFLDSLRLLLLLLILFAPSGLSTLFHSIYYITPINSHDYLSDWIENWWLSLPGITLYFWFIILHGQFLAPNNITYDKQQWLNFLAEDHYGNLYRKILGNFLKNISHFIGDEKKLKYQNPGFCHSLFSANPFTEESFRILMPLTLLYPLLSLILTWEFMEGSGTLGDLQLLPEQSDRKLLIGIIIIILSTYLYKYKSKKQLMLGVFWKGWLYMAIGSIGLFIAISILITSNVAISVGATVTVIMLSAFTSILYGLFSVFFAFTIILAFSGIILFSSFSSIINNILIAIIGAFTFYSSFNYLYQSLTKKLIAYIVFYIFNILLITAFLISINIMASATDIDKHALHISFSLSVFLVLLPLLNLPLDWLSLGVTRGLLQAIVNKTHSSWLALLWALLDLGLAVAFLLIISALMTVTLAGSNWLAGATYFDVPGFLSQIRKEPAHVNNWWLYFICFSTLVPTIIHFFIANLAFFLWVPQTVQRNLVAKIHQGSERANMFAFLYLWLTPLLGIGVGIACWALGYQLISEHGSGLANTLLDQLEQIAAWFYVPPREVATATPVELINTLPAESAETVRIAAPSAE